MALAFNVQGPVSLSIMIGDAAGEVSSPTFGSAHILGYTDNDDLISVDYDNLLEPYESTERGRMPAALIYQGTIATISATLIKWNTSVKDTLLQTMWADDGGSAGVVGQDIFNGDFTNSEPLQVHIAPTVTSGFPSSTDRYMYTFRRCWLDTISETGWGNAPKKLVLSFKCTNNSGGRLFAKAAPA